MFSRDLSKCTCEKALTGQPLIDHNSQRVLIACRVWVSPDLFRSHICDGSRRVIFLLGAGRLGNQGNTKVTEQNLIAPPEQHILWLNISMDQFLVMGVLQSLSYLPHIVNH